MGVPNVQNEDVGDEDTPDEDFFDEVVHDDVVYDEDLANWNIANDWMAGFDWSRHQVRASTYISDSLLLSGFTEVFAKAICGFYPEDDSLLLGYGSTEPPGSVVTAKRAFTPDGRPIYSIHNRLAPIMRRHADNFNIGVAEPDLINPQEWNEILSSGLIPWNLANTSRHIVAEISPIIAQMAFDQKIILKARPLGGGFPVDFFSKDLWGIDRDVSIHRVITCGINYNNPFDRNAPIDHLLYVERKDMQTAILAEAKKDYIAAVGAEFGKFVFRRKIDYVAVQIEEVTTFLIDRMNDAECAFWTNRNFKDAVEDEFGTRGLGRCFEQAKRRATQDPSRKRFNLRRPNKNRPLT